MNRKNFLTGSILILTLINGIVLSAMESSPIIQEKPTKIDINLHTTKITIALAEKILHPNELDVTFYTNDATDEDLMRWICFLYNSNVTKLSIKLAKNLDYYPIMFTTTPRKIENTNITDFSQIKMLRTLQSLIIENQSSITNLSLIESLKNLHTLEINGCDDLNDMSSISECTNLREISLYNLNNTTLTTLSNMSALKNLESLSICGLYYLKNLSATNLPESLQSLYMDICSNVETIDQMETLKKLHTLKIHQCKKIQSLILPENLQNIEIDRCDSITTLINIEKLQNPIVQISNCDKYPDTNVSLYPQQQ